MLALDFSFQDNWLCQLIAKENLLGVSEGIGYLGEVGYWTQRKGKDLIILPRNSRQHAASGMYQHHCACACDIKNGLLAKA